MKISVIVPVFNVEEYLAEAIDSVVRQTHEGWELILVDDGSGDGSGRICDEYQEKDPRRIRVLHTENHGPLEARLIGIGEATGDVLVFLDSDDSLRADTLEIISDCFQKNACDMVIYHAETPFDCASAPMRHPFEDGRMFDETSMGELYEGLIRGDVSNSVCVKAVRTACVHIPDHFRNRRMMNGEDLLLSACFMTGCRRVVCINEVLYYYRTRPGSIVHTFNVRRKDSVKFVHTELGRYVDQWNVPALKPLHNGRKVRGWVENLKQLFKYGYIMEKKDFKRELTALAEDPYFRDAYRAMEPSLLSRADRVAARCLYHKQYFTLHMLCRLKKLAAKFQQN